MTYYIKNGNTFRPTDEQNVDIRRVLPPNNYIIKQDQFGNLYFETVDAFTFPTKRYGENPRHSKRILDTFMARSSATGVMLAGEKGSGKSLLAKTVCIDAFDQHQIPTIIINAPWHGEQFNALIQSIDQRAIILFDEFEKVYDADKQEQILTLLDGVFPSQKLFMFTCNDHWRVDQHMRNRPGRIFYMLNFTGVSEEFVREYCADTLLAIEHIDTVCQIVSLFTQFNFDMLKALVEEMNRYGETPSQALAMLNVRPEFGDAHVTYDVLLLHNGTKVEEVPSYWSGNPLMDTVALSMPAHLIAAPNKPSKRKLVATYATNSVDPMETPDAPALLFAEDEEPEVADRITRLRFEPDDLAKFTADRYEFHRGVWSLTLTRRKAKDAPNWLDRF